MAKRWSFERIVAVTNLVVLVVGAALTSAAWYPKMRLDLFQVQAASQTPTVPDGDLTVVDLTPQAAGSHLYDVSYAVATKNTSAAPIKIGFSVAELYIGVLADAEIGLHQAQEVNDPPNPWDDAGRGDIAWRRVDYDASLIDGFVPAKTATGFPPLAPGRAPYENQSPGGGLTGAVAPGDSTSDTPDFLVRAMPGEYVSLGKPGHDIFAP